LNTLIEMVQMRQIDVAGCSPLSQRTTRIAEEHQEKNKKQTYQRNHNADSKQTS
jgi:hypothetical protein